MAKRKIQLPKKEYLNPDQHRVLDLDEDGTYLILGGPGTGKSVVALLRALKFQDNNDYVFLAYNKVLSTFAEQLLNMKSNRHLTILRWFYSACGKISKAKVPRLLINGYSSPDYHATLKKLQALNLKEEDQRSLHIIIDEGQDMPPVFYETLVNAGYKNIFVVADQNQQITDANSNRQQLTQALDLKVSDVIELKINYRNTYAIALFARHFHTDKASPCPDLPARPSLETPTLYYVTAHHHIYDLILREADKDDRKLIGIVVASNKVRSDYVQGLKSHKINLDHARPVISTYSSSDKTMNIDFSQGGVVVLNDKSIKGLEFDSIYIILDSFRIYNNDQTSMKKRLYVMSSRAIEKLTLITTQKQFPLLSLLPEDERVMKKVTVSNHIKEPNESHMPNGLPF